MSKDDSNRLLKLCKLLKNWRGLNELPVSIGLLQLEIKWSANNDRLTLFQNFSEKSKPSVSQGKEYRGQVVLWTAELRKLSLLFFCLGFLSGQITTQRSCEH